MADDNSKMLGDDEGTPAPASKGKGRIATLLPTLLKYIALALGAIILIVTVVIITMNIMNGNKNTASAIPISEEYKEAAEELDWYQSLGEIQTRSNDSEPASVVVNIFLGYKKEDKITSTEITAQRIPIRDYLRNYFAATPDTDINKNPQLTPNPWS